MAFERQSMEQLVTKMIGWTRGVSTKLTDFRVGSKTRTVYEAVAVIVEEFYDRVFRAQRQLIEDNIYAIIGFDKVPANYATGTVRLSRTTAADQDYFIAAGTVVMSQASQFKAPQKYRTSEDAVVAVGTLTTDVKIVCTVPGVIGNTEAGTITDFLSKPAGVDTVTNLTALSDGKEEETKEEQKVRFQKFLEAQARGVLQSLEFGAKLAYVPDPVTGVPVEKVLQAYASEDIINRKGEADLYIWNGLGMASEALKFSVQTVLKGFYDAKGNPVYGFKPAGILVNLYSATIKNVTMKLEILPETWATTADLQVKAEAEIDRYCAELKLGQTMYQTELEANIKGIDGVKDVKLYLSLDAGTTYGTANVTSFATEIIVANKPTTYVFL